MNSQFELLFMGPADDSAPTLRCIKGVFISDLEFPTSDVQRFLEEAPVTIKVDESKLEIACGLLRKAGARVSVVRSSGTLKEKISEAAASLEPDLDFVTSVLENENFRPEPAGNSLELSFELDYNKNLQGSSIERQDRKKTTDGPLLASEDFSLELSLEPTIENAQPLINQEIREESEYKFDLSLDQASETYADSLKSSDAKSNPEADIFVASTQPIKDQLNKAQLSLKQPNTNRASNNEEQQPLSELTLTDLKVPQRPHQKRPSSQFRRFAIAALIGVPLLIIFNHWFFSQRINHKLSENFQNQLLTLSADHKDKKQLQSQQAQYPQIMGDSIWFTAEQNFPDRTVKATVWVEDNIPVHGSIEVRTPQPAPLTKEEMVNNFAPSPWLRNISLKDFIFKKEQSEFSASGPAFAYVSIDNKNIRLAGHGSIKAKLSEDYRSIDLEVLASSSKTASDLLQLSPQENQLFFSIGTTNQEGSNHFRLSETLKLTR